jgi:hypothetical protein
MKINLTCHSLNIKLHSHYLVYKFHSERTQGMGTHLQNQEECP